MSNVSFLTMEPTYAPALSSAFTLQNNTAMTVICAGLMLGELAYMEVQNPENATWNKYLQGTPSRPALVQFTKSIVSIDVWASAGTYRINKGATVNLVGVSITKNFDMPDMRTIGLKLGMIVQPALNIINPVQPVIWFKYVDGDISDAGIDAINYNQVLISARVQPVSNSLMFKENLEFGYIYKRFYVLSDCIKSVDRNIKTQGDYFLYNNLYYRIMRVPEEFLTGWQEIIGQQSSGLYN